MLGIYYRQKSDMEDGLVEDEIGGRIFIQEVILIMQDRGLFDYYIFKLIIYKFINMFIFCIFWIDFWR